MCHAIFNLKGVFSLGVCYGEHTLVISFFLVSGILSGEPLPSLSPRTLSLDCARCSGVTPRKSIAFTSVPENKGRNQQCYDPVILFHKKYTIRFTTIIVAWEQDYRLDALWWLVNTVPAFRSAVTTPT